MISTSFSIDDIHKIRHQNYEDTKHFSIEQLLEKTKNDAAEERKKIAEIRKRLLLQNK